MRGFLFLDLAFNLTLHFSECLDVGILLIFNADDVKAITALHQVAGLSFREREGRFLKFRDGASAADPTQFAAALSASRIFRVLRRELRKITAGFYLLENVFGFLAGR